MEKTGMRHINDKDIILLHIETATEICSISISCNTELLGSRTVRDGNTHARHLIVEIESLMAELLLAKERLDGVSVSMGPGSYTGLRIGVSTAKGLCYALQLPLISVSTLDSIAYGAKRQLSLEEENVLYCPMIDARRMEVYTEITDALMNIIEPVQALVIEENSFEDLLQKQKVVFCGNGMPKCRSLLEKYANALFADAEISSQNMIFIAYQKYLSGKFEDVAYFEPFYLKQYIAQKSHVKGLE